MQFDTGGTILLAMLSRGFLVPAPFVRLKPRIETWRNEKATPRGRVRSSGVGLQFA